MCFKRLKIIAMCLSIAGCKIPDSVSVGFGFRNAYGSYRLSKKRKNIPFARAELDYRLKNDLEGFLKFDFIKGDFRFTDSIEHVVQGDFEAFGGGLRFYPFHEYFALETGAEVFRAKANAVGDFRLFTQRIDDVVYGWGINVGAIAEFALNDDTKLFFSGGYNFTDNESKRINFDFDGYCALLGLKIEIK
ncbi:MAG: hypothetical protein AABX08_02960 [Nanoarchaeota archaeon]